MIKIIIILGFLSFIYSCDSEETKYLYDENDPEYSDFVLAAQQECISTSSFFSTFNTYSEFDSAPFNVGEIYKISQDANQTLKIYVKVEAINGNDVTLIFNSDEPTLDKVVTYEEADHTSLGTFLKTAVCSSSYSEYFSSISGKDSTVNLSYKWYKQTILEADDADDADSEPEAYKRQWATHNVNLNYPTLLYFYNGVKDYRYVNEDGQEEQKLESKITIKEITSDDTDCKDDDSNGVPNVVACDFSTATTSTFPSCNVTVDEDAYKLTAHTTKVIEYTGTGCNMMQSGGF